MTREAGVKEFAKKAKEKIEDGKNYGSSYIKYKINKVEEELTESKNDLEG